VHSEQYAQVGEWRNYSATFFSVGCVPCCKNEHCVLRYHFREHDLIGKRFFFFGCVRAFRATVVGADGIEQQLSVECAYSLVDEHACVLRQWRVHVVDMLFSLVRIAVPPSELVLHPSAGVCLDGGSHLVFRHQSLALFGEDLFGVLLLVAAVIVCR